ncbi:MAG: ModE family transcriptional regulator, partial [bacterium]
RKAWFAIDAINKLTDNTFVILQRGGKEGGTAVITEEAEKAILFYKSASEKLEQFLIQETKLIKF